MNNPRKTIDLGFDKFPFARVYYKIGVIKGYSFVIKDDNLKSKIIDLEHTLDVALGYEKK